MRTAAKIAIVAIIVSVLSLAGGWMYHIKSQNDERQKCLQWEKSIMSLNGKVPSAELSFDANDFNSMCGDLVGPDNQLVISGNNQ